MRIVAIIQARMESSRLPGKVLAEIEGKPLLWYVVDRARQANLIDLVAVATSDRPADDAVSDFCRIQEVPCFRGSLEDVLDRYYQAAKYFKADAVAA